MALLILLGLQLLATLGVGALLWRRLDAATREIARLRTALNVAEIAASAPPLRRVGEAVRLTTVSASAPQTYAPRSITELRRREAAPTKETSALSPEAIRALVLAAIAAAPAGGLFIAGGGAPAVATGIVLSLSMMLLSLRPLWRVAAWAGVMTGLAWTSVGFALGAASEAPAIFCTALTLAGAAGLLHAHKRRAAPGLALTLIMSGAALALGAQIGLISPAGAAFGALLVFAAIVGALSARLEGVHLCAFGAALIGLFVLSGQEDAAIWFTPVTTWLGAIFLGIAALRVPELGARGLTLAATGALAAVSGVIALHASGHGLDNPLAAAAAFAVIGAALAGIVATGASREGRVLADLGLALWTLACASFFAAAAAIWIATPAPLAAPSYAVLALALIGLNTRAPHPVWRILAWIAGGLTALMAALTIVMLLSEARGWPPTALITVGILLPALLAAGAAAVASKQSMRATAGCFEMLALAGAVTSASLALRTTAADGALLLTPISLSEAGLHIAIWLAAALMLAMSPGFGARRARTFCIWAIGSAALIASAAIAVLALTPYWSAREGTGLVTFAGLGFLAPTVLYWGHWAFWRAHRNTLFTRIALAFGALLSAAFITIVTFAARHDGLPGSEWFEWSVTALSFAIAIGVNFIPAAVCAPHSNLHEDFHGPGRGEVRGEAR